MPTYASELLKHRNSIYVNCVSPNVTHDLTSHLFDTDAVCLENEEIIFQQNPARSVMKEVSKQFLCQDLKYLSPVSHWVTVEDCKFDVLLILVQMMTRGSFWRVGRHTSSIRCRNFEKLVFVNARYEPLSVTEFGITLNPSPPFTDVTDTTCHKGIHSNIKSKVDTWAPPTMQYHIFLV